MERLHCEAKERGDSESRGHGKLPVGWTLRSELGFLNRLAHGPWLASRHPQDHMQAVRRYRDSLAYRWVGFDGLPMDKYELARLRRECGALLGGKHEDR